MLSGKACFCMGSVLLLVIILLHTIAFLVCINETIWEITLQSVAVTRYFSPWLLLSKQHYFYGSH